MLDVNNVNFLPTSYHKDRKDEEFENSMTPQVRLTIEKNRKKVNQNKRVSSQQIFEKEGAIVAATPLPFLSGLFRCFRRAFRAAFHGVIQTIGKSPLTTKNVPTTKRRRFSESNKTKMQKSLRKQTKAQECNK
jgi:hypothetical protein